MIPARGAGGKSYAPAVEPPPDDLLAVGVEDLPADMLLPRLRGVREAGAGQWMACCPAHADGTPSLSIAETHNFALLVYCHAGCRVEEILGAVGLETRHLYPSDYAVHRAQKTGRRRPNTESAERVAARKAAVDVPEETVRGLTELARSYFLSALQQRLLPSLARDLGVPPQALADFGVGHGFHNGRAVWSLVERDGRGRVVGVLYRDAHDGAKKCHRGSRRGVVVSARLPASFNDLESPLYVPEGHTDAIAAHGAGALVVGRPATGPIDTAAQWLREYLLARPALWQSRPVVVVGDNDDAGRLGADTAARMLRECLQRPVYVSFPPPQYKDLRAWVTAGLFVPGWPFSEKTE